MSLPGKIKAIVLTCDRWRAITRHLILKYERLWPDHPFVFQVPYQELRGTDTDRIKYHAAPEDIKGTILHLLADIDDEEWIYWCVDDKYPIQLPTDKVTSLISHAMRSPDLDLVHRLARGTGEVRPSFAEPDGVVFAVASRLRRAHLDSGAGALTDIEASTLAHLLAGHLLRRYGTGPAPYRGPAGNCARAPSTSLPSTSARTWPT